MPERLRASHCRQRYESMKRAYGRLGVPARRLFLTEHFGNTKRGGSGGPRGRWGIAPDTWHSVIEARCAAATASGFAGYVTYAWMYNQINEPNPVRFTNAYIGSVTRFGLAHPIVDRALA